MKALSDIIIEKLRINQNTIVGDYSEKFGEGQLKTLKDCNIYKLTGYGKKYSDDEYEDDDLRKTISRYMKDTDIVWEVVEQYKNGFNVDQKVPTDILKALKMSRPILQKVNLHQYKMGYLLKEMSDGVIVLVIKEFYSNNTTKRFRYLFKI